MLEELIEQSQELGKFHQNSVNTVRFATYAKNGKISNLFSIFRMGVGESVVDNASAGGIFAKIDIQTGIINSYAKTLKNANEYLRHPDTKICILGYQIPKWNELCEIAQEAAKAFQEYPYISFDFALTDEGWKMIEANARGGFDLYQMFGIEYGLSKKFKELLKK